MAGKARTICAQGANAEAAKNGRKKASREAAALLRVEALGIEVQQVMDKDAAVAQLMTEIKQLRLVISRTKAEPAEALLSLVSEKRQSLQAGRKSSAMSATQQRILRQLMQYLSEEADQLNGVSAAETLPVLKKDFDARVKALKAQAETVSKRITNMFDFSEIIFGEGQELLIIVTELTANRDTAAFISKFDCKEYYRHNKALLLYERQGEIAEALKNLKLN